MIYHMFIGVILLQSTSSNATIRRALQLLIEMHNETDTEHEYLSNIQKLFCPDQPLCKQHDVNDSPNAQTNSSMTLQWIAQRELIQRLGLCCLPCSCDDDKCAENENCCLSKQTIDFENGQTPINTSIQKDCIAATSKSYFSRTNTDTTYPYYSMVTRCYGNRDNSTLVTRCEQPDIYIIKADETIPVYSKASGRTYWNKYCAMCHDDHHNLIMWNATVYMRRDYLIFSQRSIPVTRPQNFSDFFDTAVNAGELLYSRPDDTEPNICIPKRHIQQIDDGSFHTLCQENQFLRDACQNFDSLSIVYGLKGPIVYKNMFCLLCQASIILSEMELDCELEVFKGLAPSYTALLNLNFMADGNLGDDFANGDASGQHGCPCNTIFDSAKHICRPLFCPPDEYMVVCECMPFASLTSGMPFLLSIKIYPVNGAWPERKKDDFMTLSTGLRKALEERYKRIEFETMAIFNSNYTDHEYRLHVIRARAEQGYDAKSSFKELAESVEGPPFLRLVSKQYSYDAELTNTVTYFKDPARGYSANDTRNNLELQKLYEVRGLIGQLRWSQELSKLLYCQQVELTNTEFTEENGVVTLNVSSVNYRTTHYYHPAEDKIRICTEDFRKAFPLNASSSMLISCKILIFIFVLRQLSL